MSVDLTRQRELAQLLAADGAHIPRDGFSKEYLAAMEGFLRTQWQVMPAAIVATFGTLRSTAIPLSLRDRCVASYHLSRVQNAVTKDVVEEFLAVGVDYCLLKGTASRWACYDDPCLRSGFDIDIGLNKRDVTVAREVVERMGFIQSVWRADEKRFVRATSEERKWVEDHHYELGYLIRRQSVRDVSEEDKQSILATLDHTPNPWHLSSEGGLCVYLNVDLHHGLSHDVPLGPVLADSVMKIGLRLPSVAWQLFHLVFKIYWEGVHNYGKGLYQFGDLCRLWGHVSEDEFQTFIGLVEGWNLEAGSFYVLGRLPRTFGIALGDFAENYLCTLGVAKRKELPGRSNDLGDMWPKLWGVRSLC